METLGLSGGREQLAWERAAVTEKADDLASRLADIVKPVVRLVTELVMHRRCLLLATPSVFDSSRRWDGGWAKALDLQCHGVL